MEKKKWWKRLLSVTLSICMVVGLATVSGPDKAEASEGTNILENHDFSSASSAWVDQDGTLVPAQTLVDDVKVTSEVKYSNDFSNGSTFAWNLNNTTTPIVEKDGNKVLSFTRGANSYITYYGFSNFIVGNSYRLSCRVYSDMAVSFRLYDSATSKYDMHTTTAGGWSTYTVDLTATSTSSTLYFGIMDSSTGPVYIDDVMIEQITTETNTETVYTTEFTNDFAGSSPTWGWNTNNTTTSVVEKDGNKVLSFTSGGSTYITNYGFLGYGGFTVGTNYRITCRVYSDAAVSFRLYDNATSKYDIHTTTAGGWSTYTVDLTASSTGTTLYFGFMNGSSGTVYIDDLMIAKATEATAQTYTEGIGTCKNAETDNVLVMKDYTKVTQSVATTIGETYSYSFAVKGVDVGSDFSASVIAGGKTVQAITATSEWTTVEGQFTATENATNFGFARAGEGELWIDDVVLYSSKPTPTDHTSLDGPYIPDGYKNLLSGAATDFSSSEHGHTVPNGSTVQNGYLKTTMASGNTIQFAGMSAVAGQEYTFSCYIWTEGTNYCLQMYEAGSGSASGSNWSNLTYACKADTNGWVKAEYSFTANGTGAVYIGFQQTWGGSATVYVDDVSFATVKPSPSDHTVQGGAYIPEGTIAVFSQDMSTSNNLNLTSLSTATVADGMLKLPFAGTGYVQTNPITVQANTAYTLSFYAWVDGAADGFKFNIFASGAGNGWKDNVITSIAGDTDGWQLVTYQFTATSASTIAFGFKNYGDAAGTVYVDDLALSTEATGEATDITLSYGTNANFHYEQENRLYIQSTGTTTADLAGTLEINGTEVSMTYKHYDKSLVLLFGGKLSETDVNKIVIPAGTTLYNGSIAVYNIATTFTIYTQKVADDQWMTWLSEYDYQGSDVLYYDMGTAGTKYVFNNVADMTYQGVLTVTGKADIMLGGTTNASKDVTALGDYEVSRTMKGEKYDYTVALYKRGDADKTQDGELTAKDLVASKLAVSAAPDTFGHARYKAADSNTDGAVNEEDAAFMRRILANDYDIMTTTSKGYSTLGQGVMPIIGYSGPSDHATSTNTDLKKRSELGYQDDFLTDSIFALVKALGFNVFINQVNEVGNDYETSTKMLKLAEKYNLGVFINNAYISNQSYVQEQLPIQTGKYDSFSSFHGYYVEDEPENESAISNYTTQLTALKNHANIASYFNMSPIGDSSFLTKTAYEKYLKAALATGAESLSYDMYLRGKNKLIEGFEIKTTDFYKNLDVARTLSMSASKPFQAFVQTGANWIDTSIDRVSNNNRLTIQEMYLEANAALAMGAKGINYFTLVESATQVDEKDNDSGLITIAGAANHNEGGNYDYYNAAKKINTFIAAVDEVLMNATNQGVISDNPTVTSNVTCERSNYGAVQSITGSEYMIGCFDYYGKDAYLIVNITPDEGDSGSSQNITLNFDGTYSYTATDMTCTKTTTSGQSASFAVGAGEAVLVVVE